MKHVACKAEEFIEVVGLISALSDQDIDRTVTANLEEVLHRFSGIRAQQAQHTQGPGRSGVLEHQVLCGLPAFLNRSDVRSVKEDHQETHETKRLNVFTLVFTL